MKLAKYLFVALPLLSGAVLAAEEGTKPFPPDTQIRFLKLQRDFQQKQINAATLQRQFDQAIAEIGKVQAQLEAECEISAKAANVDLAKFSCNLDKLAFVPKPAEAPKPPAEKK